MCYVNANTTGAPFLFGYEVLWGKAHGLGFHRAPWGEEHTPAQGLALVNLYFLRLQDYLYETPIPALLPAIGALALTKQIRPADRYLLVASGLLVLFYFAYWAEGDFLGPRFLYALGPVVALWTVRCPPLLLGQFRHWNLRARALSYRVVVFTIATSAAIALVIGVPLRALQYYHNFKTERWATPSVAAGFGVRGALVFVREGWIEQIVARMWALGVSRPHAEMLYRAIDACRLDSAVTALEAQPRHAEDPFPALAPLLRDSANVAPMLVGAAEVKVRMQRDYAYSANCRRRLAETAAGSSPLAPLQVVEGSDKNIYARDLHARDSVVLAEYPERAIYLVHPTSDSSGALPAFFPVSRDSLIKAWRDEPLEQRLDESSVRIASSPTPGTRSEAPRHQ
jgi:hypothetical protein